MSGCQRSCCQPCVNQGVVTQQEKSNSLLDNMLNKQSPAFSSLGIKSLFESAQLSARAKLNTSPANYQWLLRLSELIRAEDFGLKQRQTLMLIQDYALLIPPFESDIKLLNKGSITEDQKHRLWQLQSTVGFMNFQPLTFRRDSARCTWGRSRNAAKSLLLKLHCGHRKGHHELIMDKEDL